MRYIFLLLIVLSALVEAKDKYMDNHSCNECHEEIYEEYQTSSHSKSYFSNTLHRQIADYVSREKYSCATCHMPMADNMKELLSGEARPDKSNKTHTDGVSCFFCHTVAYVRTAHKFNINTKARQAKGYKPTLYGRLNKPDDSDKHSSASNPVYAKKVCMGCHSHKINDNNATIFRAMSKEQDSISCINCHMPELSGGAEKMDKRARGRHASHKFLGIHDVEFRKTGIDINITTSELKLTIRLKNKMTHPLIVQPARAKYLKIVLSRAGKVIWKNYKKEPSEDKKGYFAYRFKREGKEIIVPAHATESLVNNVEAESTKLLEYTVPLLQKGDKISVGLYVQLAKSDCAKVIALEERNLTESSLMKERILIQE
ncbi:MAG: multiheme c-type cytochrome [Campylobacterota bacterium]|nr:multiheme c-type cytochrome [Campylobacterota bacterium]